jgi:hypothetical protein
MQTYTNAQYLYNFGTITIGGIRVDINGVTSSVPIDPANTDYANIMLLVSEGQLVIAPAA